MIILGIESSCDETACAIVENGRRVLSNVVASQVPTHKEYGGVVPEIASRLHLESINAVIEEALLNSKIEPQNIDAFAATAGPGLSGSLLVGLTAAKSLSLVYDKPFIPINHLKAHVCANYLETDLEPPFVALLVSGGHTQIIKVDSYNKSEIVGETLDDAVGEVYDKVARVMGLCYPGGVYLDKLAQTGNPKAYKLPEGKVSGYDFSFSGLKTAALRLIKSLGENYKKEDVAASFQEGVSSTLLKKTKAVADLNGYKKLVLAGGVAANSEIRKKFFDLKNEGYEVFAPPMKFCTDNASMAASCAYFCPMNVENPLEMEVFSRA